MDKEKTGHFYFGKDRTSVLWADIAETQLFLPMSKIG